MVSIKKTTQILLGLFLLLLLLTATIHADEFTKLFLKGDGENNSTVISDSSDNNHQVTINGDVKISTNNLKYGSGAMVFDGTEDYLTISDHNDWDFGNKDFTIDAWVYATGTGNYEFILARRDTSVIYFLNMGGNGIFRFGSVTGGIIKYINGNSGDMRNQWFHFAIVRSGTTISMYINGVAQTQTLDVGSQSFAESSLPIHIGHWTEDSQFDLEGYIDNLRVTKNKALWTSNFNLTEEELLYSNAPTISFTSDKTEYNPSQGGPVTLSWDVTNADPGSISISPGDYANLDPAGSIQVTPESMTNYVISATVAGANVTKELLINVVGGYNFTGNFKVDGKIGIGVLNPVNELEVNGIIKAKEITVTLDDWADYVFGKDYKLENLRNLENYIRENQHLPGIPSTSKLKEEGLEVSEMLKLHMQKIEELTLYVIELSKENKILKQQIQELK